MNEKLPQSPVRTQYAEGSLIDWSSLASLYRPSEWVVLTYFTYTAFLTVSFNLPASRRAEGFAIPVLLCLLGYLASSNSRFWTTVVRDWTPTALVLLAYWQLDWFQTGNWMVELQNHWLSWDHTILIVWGVRSAIESLGALLPSIVEIAYTLLYSIPPVAIGILYFYRRRERVETFLFPFLLGTFLAYALLPHFPTASPRVEFPGLDVPTITTVWRRFNIGILRFGDIDTSVFPSGHVTAAFSAAFAMMRALPEKRWVGRLLLVMAILITTATIYGRYHYAADGIAGLALSVAAIGISGVLRRD